MSKKVQIDLNMFFDIYKLIFALKSYEVDSDTSEIIKRLEEAFDAKLDAMRKHSIYTQSKIAPTEEEREIARQRYLDSIGMQENWRYNKDH